MNAKPISPVSSQPSLFPLLAVAVLMVSAFLLAAGVLHQAVDSPPKQTPSFSAYIERDLETVIAQLGVR